MQKDYPELEGEPVKFTNTEMKYDGKVVGCSYDIGITIVNAKDSKDYLVCINGPSSPNEGYEKEPYDKVFYTTIDMIKKGLVEAQILELIYNPCFVPGFFNYMDECPWGA